MKRSSEPSSARWITYGRVLGVVGAHVAEAEALRHLGVELDRPHLPRAAERVESCAGRSSARRRRRRPRSRRTRSRAARAPSGARASVKSHSSSVPSLFSGRVESSNRALEPEQVVERRPRSRGSRSISSSICSGVQKMCASSWVNVRTRSRPCSAPVSSSRWSGAGLGEAERQVAVAERARRRRAAVAGAVHRLQRERRGLLGLEREHVLAVLLPVARGLPERLVVDDAASSPRRSRARAFSRRRRSSSAFQITIPFGCQNGEPGEMLGEVEEVELRRRAGGGRACAPPRAARGARRGRPACRRPCRRSASAACCARRRASTRRRGR